MEETVSLQSRNVNVYYFITVADGIHSNHHKINALEECEFSASHSRRLAVMVVTVVHRHAVVLRAIAVDICRSCRIHIRKCGGLFDMQNIRKPVGLSDQHDGFQPVRAFENLQL